MSTLFPIPPNLVGLAKQAEEKYAHGDLRETIAFCGEQLAALDKQMPPRSNKPPESAEPASAEYQYYALTLILVDAQAQIQDWKGAKETLGKYRVRFPRDPWGFRAGAEVTRRDPVVHDKAAVERAIELLQGEAERLESKV